MLTRHQLRRLRLKVITMAVSVPEVCDCCGMPKLKLTELDQQWLCDYCQKLIMYGDVYVHESDVVTPYVYT